jgi:hypothetical protein
MKIDNYTKLDAAVYTVPSINTFTILDYNNNHSSCYLENMFIIQMGYFLWIIDKNYNL